MKLEMFPVVLITFGFALAISWGMLGEWGWCAFFFIAAAWLAREETR